MVALGRALAAGLVLAGLATGSRAAAGDPDIAAVAAAIRPDAMAQGVAPALFDAVFAGLTPDPTIETLTRRQPEFSKPLGAYLATQVTPAKVAGGQALLRRWSAQLHAIERRFGVPAPILVAVWGLETNYGASAGTKDVIRSMATLAALNVRPDLYRAELLAALGLLQSGAVTRDQLRGSWAGAMGQPQFMPSSFAAYAVDGDGDGRRDIWMDVPDALASIANFLQAKGWQSGSAWGWQVTLPGGFDIGQDHAAFGEWTARGVRRADGAALPSAGEAVLFFPTGAAGPAFLVTGNYEVIKSYNFSDAYVLSVADLADRIAGRPALRGPWPSTPGLDRDARIALQSRLAERGYPVDNREGRISLALRASIRRAQRNAGLAADGNPTSELSQALATGH